MKILITLDNGASISVQPDTRYLSAIDPNNLESAITQAGWRNLGVEKFVKAAREFVDRINDGCAGDFREE